MRFARFAFAVITPAAIASLSAGCSDPVPPTQQGAWEVNFASTDGSKCGVMSHSANIGSISATQRTTVVPDGGALVDGGDTATVSCFVAANSAGSFYVQGTINQGARSLGIAVTSIKPSARESAPATGSVSFMSEITVSTYSSANCEFYFEEGSTRLAPGQAWISFKCPELTAASKLGAVCGLAESYAILENCAQTVPEQ